MDVIVYVLTLLDLCCIKWTSPGYFAGLWLSVWDERSPGIVFLPLCKAVQDDGTAVQQEVLPTCGLLNWHSRSCKNRYFILCVWWNYFSVQLNTNTTFFTFSFFLCVGNCMPCVSLSLLHPLRLQYSCISLVAVVSCWMITSRVYSLLWTILRGSSGSVCRWLQYQAQVF